MTDIQIIDEHYVRMQKLMYHESEVILAKCFSFDINIDTGVIVADLKKTTKRALFEFIRLSFKNFSESPLEETRRNEFYARLENIYNNIAAEIEPIVAKALPYYEKLYKHQKFGITESYYKQHMLFAYEQRLGKTSLAASISRVHNIPRTLIVCPNNVKYTWLNQLTKEFGYNELYFTLLDASKQRTIRAFSERFVIINYDILAKYEQELMSAPIGHFIIDECHKIKNVSTGFYKNLSKIVHHFPDARISLLSGTPVKNRIDDVYAYLKLIGHELGKNKKKFLDEYTVQSIGRFTKVTGGKNLQDLYIKLSNFMIRKTQAECLDLPEKVYMSYRYELDDYRKEYDAVIEELSQQKEASALSGSLHSLNIITARAKIKGICEIAEEIIESGKKVVIFSGYKVPIGLLEEYFGSRCVKITGGMPPLIRDQNQKRFWDDETCQVLLGNTRAAGEGIDLSCASDIIVCDFPLTSAELQQAINRCTAPNKKETIGVHYTFCEDSIDEYIFELLSDKQRDINALIDKGKEVMVRENMQELLISKLLKRPIDESNNVIDSNNRDIPYSDVRQPASTESLKDVIKDITMEGKPYFQQENHLPGIPDFLT